MVAEGSAEPIPLPSTVLEPWVASRVAGLRYVSDDAPGIRRVRRGKTFTYKDADGKAVHDRATLKRIKSLAIPPAWTDVWICHRPDGHLQATGRDQRGPQAVSLSPALAGSARRTQVQPHGRVRTGAAAHPRSAWRKTWASTGLRREKVLATVVRLLETTLIRVGNEEYARENRSFGLTTLRDRHVDVDGATINFEFRGKSGEDAIDQAEGPPAGAHRQDLPRSARARNCFSMSTRTGDRRTIDSADVNDYLREISGEEFTAKDFRTWAGTVLAALALQEFGPFETQAAAKRNVTQAIERVAQKLGNTPAICRKCYVHPEVINGYLNGTLTTLLKNGSRKTVQAIEGLEEAEGEVMQFLSHVLEQTAAAA